MLSYKSSRYQPVALPPERGSQRLHARRPRSLLPVPSIPPAPRGGESESSAPTVAALRSSGDIIASGLPLNVHPGPPSRSDREQRALEPDFDPLSPKTDRSRYDLSVFGHGGRTPLGGLGPGF